MLEKIKSTVQSREFQTVTGQVVIAVASIVAANVTSKLVQTGGMKGLTALMDKIHGKIEVTPTAE